MKKVITIVLSALLLLCSCVKRSELKTETGVVIMTQYTPPLNATSSGVGFNSDGNTVFTVSTINEPARFHVIFRCHLHKKTFAIESQELFARLSRGDTVRISYYELTGGLRDEEFEFVDAVTY
jgi:hypothetical protein